MHLNSCLTNHLFNLVFHRREIQLYIECLCRCHAEGLTNQDRGPLLNGGKLSDNVVAFFGGHARLVPRGRVIEHLWDDYCLVDPSHGHD
jgi:hypothetical protein